MPQQRIGIILQTNQRNFQHGINTQGNTAPSQNQMGLTGDLNVNLSDQMNIEQYMHKQDSVGSSGIHNPDSGLQHAQKLEKLMRQNDSNASNMEIKDHTLGSGALPVINNNLSYAQMQNQYNSLADQRTRNNSDINVPLQTQAFTPKRAGSIPPVLNSARETQNATNYFTKPKNSLNNLRSERNSYAQIQNNFTQRSGSHVVNQNASFVSDNLLRTDQMQDFLGSKIMHTNENIQSMANEIRLRHLAIMQETKNSRKGFPSYLAQTMNAKRRQSKQTLIKNQDKYSMEDMIKIVQR